MSVVEQVLGDGIRCIHTQYNAHLLSLRILVLAYYPNIFFRYVQIHDQHHSFSVECVFEVSDIALLSAGLCLRMDEAIHFFYTFFILFLYIFHCLLRYVTKKSIKKVYKKSVSPRPF